MGSEWIDQGNTQAGPGHLHGDEGGIGVEHMRRGAARSVKGLVDAASEAKRVGHADQRLFGQLRDRQQRMCRQRGVCRQHCHARGFADPVDVQAAVLKGQAHCAEIDGFGQHRLDHVFRRHTVQLNVVGAQRRRQMCQRRRQQARSQCRDAHQLDMAVLVYGDVLGALANIADTEQRALDLGVHHEGFLRRGDFWATALEQGKPEFLFELLDHARDRGLGTPEHLPGGRKTARRHDCGERFELTQIHGARALCES